MTPPVVFNSFPLPVTDLTAVEPPRDRRRVASLYFRDCTAVVLGSHGGDGGATAGGGTAVMELLLRGHGGHGGATAVLVRCHGGHGGSVATPLRIGPTRGCFEDVQSFRRATANVRGFDSFRRCYGDQWRNHSGTTTIMAVPLRFMSYKHRSGIASSVWRGYYCWGTAEHVKRFRRATAKVRGFWQFSAVLRRSMTEPLRNHGDHGGATAVYAVQAPQWHRASGVTGV